MSRNITHAIARALMQNALASARLEGPAQVSQLCQVLDPATLQSIAMLISQAYNNGVSDGETECEIKHAYAASDRLCPLTMRSDFETALTAYGVTATPLQQRVVATLSAEQLSTCHELLTATWQTAAAPHDPIDDTTAERTTDRLNHL